MEENELDEWFSEQRERLEERFYKEAEKDVTAAKTRFDKDYKALLRDLQKKEEAIYESQQRRAAIQRPIARIKERWRLFWAPVVAWPKRARERVRKWFFDRKIRRILKDKSDL